MNARLFNLKQGDLLFPTTAYCSNYKFYLILTSIYGGKFRYMYKLKDKIYIEESGSSHHAFYTDEWCLVRKSTRNT